MNIIKLLLTALVWLDFFAPTHLVGELSSCLDKVFHLLWWEGWLQISLGANTSQIVQYCVPIANLKYWQTCVCYTRRCHLLRQCRFHRGWIGSLPGIMLKEVVLSNGIVINLAVKLKFIRSLGTIFQIERTILSISTCSTSKKLFYHFSQFINLFK